MSSLTISRIETDLIWSAAIGPARELKADLRRPRLAARQQRPGVLGERRKLARLIAEKILGRRAPEQASGESLFRRRATRSDRAHLLDEPAPRRVRLRCRSGLVRPLPLSYFVAGFIKRPPGRCPPTLSSSAIQSFEHVASGTLIEVPVLFRAVGLTAAAAGRRLIHRPRRGPCGASAGFANRVDVLVALAQQVLLHLAHRVARQLVDEDHPLRAACTWRAGRRAPSGSPRSSSARARLRHHDGGDAFAEIRMRHADHGAFDDAGNARRSRSRSPSDRRCSRR